MLIGNILQVRDFFQTEQPFDPSNFVHFRKRMGEGVWNFFWDKTFLFIQKPKQKMKFRLILPFRRRISLFYGCQAGKKVIDNCVKIAEKKVLYKEQSYKRVNKQLLRSAYFGHHPKRQKNARMARKNSEQSAKDCFGIGKKLPESVLKDYQEIFAIYLKALTQENYQGQDLQLAWIQVTCIAKGKSGKNYEFGIKLR